jgi:hypothetical protein
MATVTATATAPRYPNTMQHGYNRALATATATAPRYPNTSQRGYIRARAMAMGPRYPRLHCTKESKHIKHGFI